MREPSPSNHGEPSGKATLRKGGRGWSYLGVLGFDFGVVRTNDPSGCNGLEFDFLHAGLCSNQGLRLNRRADAEEERGRGGGKGQVVGVGGFGANSYGHARRCSLAS